MHDAYLTFYLLGRTQRRLGLYEEAADNMNRAMELSMKHSDEFATDSWLIYRKIHLLFDAGRIALCNMDTTKCIQQLDESFHLAKEKRGHEIRQQSDPLYHKAWALFINGANEDAVRCIQRSIDILTANNVPVFPFLTDAKEYFMQQDSSTKEEKLQLYRYKFTLTDDGYPSLADALSSMK